MNNLKKFTLTGIGHALTDVTIRISDSDLEKLNLTKSSSTLISSSEQEILIKALGDNSLDLSTSSGGSVANTIHTFVKVGGKGAFIGSVGDDLFGNKFADDLAKNGVYFDTPKVKDHNTGTSVVLITPDGERTMSTSLGIGGKLKVRQIDSKHLLDSEWLLIEGYLLANPDVGINFVKELIDLAKRCGNKLAFTCSDPWVVLSQRENLFNILPAFDLITANDYEGYALVNGKELVASDTIELSSRSQRGVEIANSLLEFTSEVIITCGSSGCVVAARDLSELLTIETTLVEKPVDLTGAGDAFLAGYLYKRLHCANQLSNSYKEAALFANSLANKVITKLGARLEDSDL
jgi:sugar/nucleoside kinase (ribokinase family)